jgi:hypothetical protein
MVDSDRFLEDSNAEIVEEGRQVDLSDVEEGSSPASAHKNAERSHSLRLRSAERVVQESPSRHDHSLPLGVVRPLSARTQRAVSRTPLVTPRPMSARSAVSLTASRLSVPRCPKAPRQRRVDNLQLFCDAFLGERIVDHEITLEAIERTAMTAKALALQRQEPMMSAFYGRKLDPDERKSVYGGQVKSPSHRVWHSCTVRLTSQARSQSVYLQHQTAYKDLAAPTSAQRGGRSMTGSSPRVRRRGKR